MQNSMPLYLAKKIENFSLPDLPQSKISINEMMTLNQLFAIIEFDLSGTVLTANDNFLYLMRYDLNEIVGKQHSIFFDPSFINNNAYKDLWLKLIHGASFTDKFKCLGKEGQEVWIQASYNTIYDLNAKPFKVIKYATEISTQKGIVTQINHHIPPSPKIERHNILCEKPSFEMDPLQKSIHSAIEHLNKLMNDIANASYEVIRLANEIKLTSRDLREKTDSQTRDLEETFMSMDQTKRHTQSSEHTISLENEATNKAEQGEKVILETLDTLVETVDSTQQISELMGAINNIVFQTHLLAINAAVEAAQAGEKGRLLGMTASNMRDFTQPTAQTAIEFQEKIDASVKRIKYARLLVRESAENLMAIVVSTHLVANMTDKMNMAKENQSKEFNDFTLALSKMNSMADQNEYLAEKTTKISENLLLEAEKLRGSMMFFNLFEK